MFSFRASTAQNKACAGASRLEGTGPGAAETGKAGWGQAGPASFHRAAGSRCQSDGQALASQGYSLGLKQQRPPRISCETAFWSFISQRKRMVGDPGIEPGMSRLGGVTVRCHTL